MPCDLSAKVIKSGQFAQMMQKSQAGPVIRRKMSEKIAEFDAGRAVDAVLSVHDVTFGYSQADAVLRGITGVVRRARVCAVIGPNAAGKSTLVKLMLGQLEPWSGQVRLGEAPVTGLSPRQRAMRLSYVPQRGGGSFAFTVREVVEMGRYAGGADRAAIERAMASCGLEDLTDRAFIALSAGQQQRVLVARAMAQAWSVDGYAGKVMLLDEPGSNMDLRHAHRLMQQLADKARQGLAVVIVLHDLNLASRYADDVWLLDEGRLVSAGPWDAVLRPSVLEPVYGVSLRALTPDETGRPVFVAEPSGTLS